jgi:ubiquinone/menaquinone biosynthesis methyltransferase
VAPRSDNRRLAWLTIAWRQTFRFVGSLQIDKPKGLSPQCDVSLNAAFDTAESKRQYVRTLFATIADRYDLITAVLSYGQDARWKAKLVAIAEVREGERALDLAAGTGDIAFAVAARGAKTVALDLTHRMLQLARDKSRAAAFITGDMTSLPFRSASFDLVTTGYGFRNVPDLIAAIDEVARVLKPGGRLLSLDFNRPENAIVRAAYLSYLTIVGAALGWILHRDPDTYRYIPESIRRYPGARGIADRLASRGFDRVTVIPLLFGLMSLHVATLPTQRIA